MPPGLGPEEAEAFLSIKRGIPVAARDEISAWLVDNKYNHESVSWEFMTAFQTASGLDLRVGHQKLLSAGEARKYFRGLDETTLTYLLDYVISDFHVKEPQYRAPSRVSSLQKILDASGSSWTLGERQSGRYGLLERIPGAVVHVVDQVLLPADRASALLRRAWDGAYGVSTTPSHAYYDAVKAVEVLANPLISPRDRDATLGKDINVLRGQAAKWKFAMAGSKQASAVEHVISMMQLLWHSHSDRHGAEDYADVTLAEAQAAVLLASTLVGWLAQGALQMHA